MGIEKAYGSYQELLSDRNVDAVYIPLPNHLHVPWSIRALKAGKHVLCEKPIGLSVAEAEQLAGAAAAHPKLKMMEAFMYRFHPQWQTARQLVREGRIGQLRTIQTFFSYFNDDPQNIRNQRDIGGGALMDIGCYPISLSRFIFDAEPERVLGHIERDPNTQVDRLTSGVLEFFQGTSTFTCATQLVPYQRVKFSARRAGSRSRFRSTRRSIGRAACGCRSARSRARRWKKSASTCATSTRLQADAFARAIMDDTPVPTPLADAVANMRVIERVATSAKKNAWA